MFRRDVVVTERNISPGSFFRGFQLFKERGRTYALQKELRQYNKVRNTKHSTSCNSGRVVNKAFH